MRQVEAAWLGRSKVLHYTVSIIYERLLKINSKEEFCPRNPQALALAPTPHPFPSDPSHAWTGSLVCPEIRS